MKNNKTAFIVLGVILLVNAFFVNYAYLSAGKFPEGIMAVSITIMSFCMAYLSDHFAAKDERAQKIRERGVFVSYFWMLGIIIILMALVNPYVGPVQLSAYHLLLLIASLYISVVFLNMVYYARKY
ncbi:permease [Rossellomorea sp. NS-SX7]|uniref:permease n=1 Tax=Rossellomorea sp. NS-SX7 TaxID=3463856 RepID=UPI00405A0E6D